MSEIASASARLPEPARYFPIERGTYEVAPGLKLLHGSSGRDGQALQLDREFPRYRAAKLEARAERLGKYVVAHEASDELLAAVNEFFVGRMLAEHPACFARSGPRLACRLTGDELDLAAGDGFALFDALCSQVQEDVAVVRLEDDRDWLALLHLCFPNHWAAEDKIGRPFVEVHAPIPGIERINRSARHIVDAMVHKGPFTRFAWGLASDDRLNHHPVTPEGQDPNVWRGRAFSDAEVSDTEVSDADPRGRAGEGPGAGPGSRPPRGDRPPFYLRVERQVTWGLPEWRAAVFLIRTYFVDGREIRSRPEERLALRSALESMSPESRAYKGVAEAMPKILEWLGRES